MLKRLLLAATLLLSPAAAHAAWHQASSAHFTIYSDESPDRLRAFAGKLERFDQAVRARIGLPDPPLTAGNRLNVYVMSDAGAVARLAGDRNVAGFYIPRASGSVAFVPRRAGGGGTFDLDAQTVFFHEYTHHLMLGNVAGIYPEWLVEGFAEFHATAKIQEDGSVGFGYPPNYRAYGLLADSAKVPLEQLLSGGYGKLSLAQRDHIYGRGWLLYHYLNFSAERKGQLSAYLAALASGKTGLDAAAAAFGDLKQLGRELDKYLMQRRISMLLVSAARLNIGPVAVRPMGAGEAAFIRMRMRSTRGVDDKTAKALVADARRAAAPFAGDPVVQAQLAEVELDAGNIEEADAAATRALAVDSKNVQALVYKGRTAMAAAARDKSTDPAMWRRARGWLVQASRVDTEDPEPKVLYHASFLAAGAAPSKNAVDALLYALQLVPQDSELRIQVARQHLTDGKLADARAVLGPVAYNPHGDARRNWAAKVMAKLVANDAAGALGAWDDVPKKDVEEK